jgi:pimeloyl-ACP methyl ester carboxylesterase
MQNINDKRIANFLLKNLSRNDKGEFIWLLNIKAIHDQLPYILEGIEIEKFTHLRDQLTFKVLFLKGEKSDYINETDLYKIKEMYPKAEITTIFDAGHWLHAEQPEAFLKAVTYFLNE